MNRNFVIYLIVLVVLIALMYYFMERQKQIEQNQLVIAGNQQNIISNQVSIALTVGSHERQELIHENERLKETIKVQDALIKRIN